MGERSGHDTPQGKARRDDGEPAPPEAGSGMAGQLPPPSGGAPVFLSELAGPDLVVTSATPAAGTALAGGDASLVGCRLADVVRGPGGQQLVATLREVHATGRHARNVLWRAGAPGGPGEAGGEVFRVSVVPLRRPDGSVGGVVVAGLGMNRQRPGTPDPGRETGAAERHGQLHPRPAEEDFAAPRGLPVLPGLRLAARYVTGRPRADAGWLDVVMLPDGAAVLMAGTAGEHVQGPAGEAVHLRMVLRDMLRRGAGPAGALAAFRGLATESAQTREAGACVVRVDPASGELSYASSGDSVLVLCPPAGEASFLPSPGGEPPGQGDHPGATAAVLPPGGVLLVCPGGQDRAITAGNRRLADLAAQVIASGGFPAAGDTADRVCVVAAQWLAQGSKAGEAIALAAHRLPDPAGGWSMQFPADPRALGGLRTGLRGWLAGLGADPADRADVELAVWEAAVNAAVHGRAGPGAGTVSVQAGLDGAGNVLIRVADQGQWRLGGTAAPGHGWAGGRGLSVISQVTDEVSIAPGPAGTTVTIRRRLRHPVSRSPAPS